MDKEAFKGSTSGRLVRTNIALTPYWAFLPHPLPPQIPPTWKLTRLLAEAEHQVGVLAGLARNIPDPDILIEPFMRREAVLSSRIEGTHTALPELLGYESGHLLPGYSKSNQALLENREVLNYVSALKSGLEWIRHKPVNLELIKELHRILLYGVRGDEFPLGEFREMQNFIGKTNDPDDANFIPPPVEELSAVLRQFERYIENGNSYPALIRIALVHYQFETIHPFLDGNGRVGRLLIVILLAAWNLLPVSLLYPSDYLEKHREQYYENLLKVSRDGDWENWLAFFLHMVLDQSLDTIKRSNAIIELKENWEDLLRQKRVSAYYFRIVDHLFSRPYVSVSDIEKLLSVTNKAARSMVENLAGEGVLVLSEEKKYGRIYEAAPLVKILQEH